MTIREEIKSLLERIETLSSGTLSFDQDTIIRIKIVLHNKQDANILMVGGVSAGKSTLLNALMGSEICPMNNDEC